MDKLLRTAKCGLQFEQHSAVQVVEQVPMDQFLWDLTPEECIVGEMRAPQTPTELVDALESTLVTLDLSKQETVKMRPEAAGRPAPNSWPNTGPRRQLQCPTPSQ